MAKHFMTVCVFCLLCATHTSCSSHVKFSANEKQLTDEEISILDDPQKEPMKNTVFDKITDRYSPTDDNLLNVNNKNLDKFNDKRLTAIKKRETPKVIFDETVYINKIFNSFGNGETIDKDGFVRLIKSLHLDRLLESKVEVGEVNLSSSMQNDTNTKCMDHRDLIKSVARGSGGTNVEDILIDTAGFQRLCPVLLYQFVAPSSAERQGCIKLDHANLALLQSNPHRDHPHVEIPKKVVHKDASSNIISVWLYSTLSIIIISACGLLAVLIIPIMQQHFYQHLIQFLVALAVGTLAGDALIHLLPHAMMSHVHDDIHMDHDLQHSRNMWLGVVAMVGVIFFFFMEKGLTLGTEWRKQRQLRNNEVPPRVRVVKDVETASTSFVCCRHKYSSYPYCYDAIATETQDDHHNHPENHQPMLNSNETSHNNTTSTIIHEINSDSELVNHGDGPAHHETNQNQCPCQESSVNQQVLRCTECSRMLTDFPETLLPNNQHQNANHQLPESDSYMVILRTHENQHHGHSHTHGHVHSAPKSLSSVAWMVIMGDGLHNFTDGMAIGAAFAGSLAGGFSTAVAVFCHELPHELGDFALLLKAGMSARQAVCYNMLSSVLCLFGMILGVVLGNNDTLSGWMFAAAAGIFLYIALVDMVPELTTNHSKEGGSIVHCILQFFGLITGLIVMLLIAMFEKNLKTLFEN